MSKARQGVKREDLSIVLCGQAGQGVQTVEHVLTRVLKQAGYHVFATKEYMSRVRGGANSTTIRVSGKPVAAYVSRMDVLVALNSGAIDHVAERLSPETIVLAEADALADVDPKAARLFEVPFTETASEIGNKIYSNIVAVGAIAGLLGLDVDETSDYVKHFFASKSEDIVANNVKAVQAGYEAAGKLEFPDDVRLGARRSDKIKDHLLISGDEAVGLGVMAGGCNFISSYPMSPATGVLIFLAKHGAEHGVLAEQAEDEISAMNMSLGAWYAGARAMVSTSGGGFALMTEGLSLAGMIESPMVIHLAQRPGPATGLPTRSEQGDLEMALYAGHGEFGRVILAPGTLEQAFELSHKAFDLADRYQVPVFILTDQYLMDTYYNIRELKPAKAKVDHHIVETSEDYRRFKITKNGISPRGIPGYGKGLVAVDSDEHDEEGHITEDLNLRVRMVDKRLAKAEGLKKRAVRPELVGPEDYRTLVICWGSTYHVVKEALERLGHKRTAMLHFGQVYPLHPSTAEIIVKAKKTIVVENNATGQFRKLLRLYAGVETDEGLVKYDGLSFSVEEVMDGLTEISKG